MSIKIEASLAAFSPCNDRFVPEGYKEGLALEEQLKIISKIDGIDALPMLYDDKSMAPDKMKVLLGGYGLQVGTVCADNYTTAKWKHGSLASRDKNIRKEIVKRTQDAMDYCAACGGVDTMLWLAHDGYDYPFEDDYMVRWGYIAECLHEIASYRSDINLTIEYKKSEPRSYQYISNISKSLLMCEEVGLPNLGVIIDIGHALFGGENPAESVALANKYGRLFHIHLNDNYRQADDDLILGTVHLWETLEFFYQLDTVGYDGWYVIDIWPGRVDGIAASQEFVDRSNALMNIAQSLPKEQIKKMQADNDSIGLLKLIRERTLRG